jgi:RNA polymerase sigma-70 factor (ECF subfamily)
MSVPDEVVVQRILAGEAELFRILVRRYREEFARYAASLCGDADVAADAMQEAFIRAFDALDSCREPARFKAWFFRILTNQCHNARRGLGVRGRLDDIVVTAADRADAGVSDEELREAIDAALGQLTPEQREAFVLKHVDGRSYAEIADLLGVGEDALKMRVHRARDALKKLLEPWS